MEHLIIQYTGWLPYEANKQNFIYYNFLKQYRDIIIEHGGCPKGVVAQSAGTIW